MYPQIIDTQRKYLYSETQTKGEKKRKRNFWNYIYPIAINIFSENWFIINLNGYILNLP